MPGLALLAGRRGPGLRRDLLAGVVLAALLVPQGMGYAQLAGLPPVTGLYATLIPLVVYFLLGPSRILIISPDSAVCPLVAAAIIPLAGADADQRVALAGLLALVVGAVMLAGGLARFGFVTELLSMPVRVGYLAGIALTVIVSQLPKLFGFSVDAEDFIGAVREFITGLDETDPTALAFGAGCLAVILGLRLISPRLPGVLIAVVGATALVAALGLSDELPIVGSVPSGLPAGRLARRGALGRHGAARRRRRDRLRGLRRHQRSLALLRRPAAPAGRPEPGARRARRRQPRRRRLPGLPHLLQRLAHRRRGGHGRPQPARRPGRGAHPRRCCCSPAPASSTTCR